MGLQLLQQRTEGRELVRLRRDGDPGQHMPLPVS
jgi:hypothetical protein